MEGDAAGVREAADEVKPGSDAEVQPESRVNAKAAIKRMGKRNPAFIETSTGELGKLKGGHFKSVWDIQQNCIALLYSAA